LGNIFGGSATTNYGGTTQTAAAPQAINWANAGLSGIQNIVNQPYNPLAVPDPNAQQMLGIGDINQFAQYAQPNLAAATGLASNAAQPITGAQIQSYLNPYTAAVVAPTLQAFSESLGIAQDKNAGLAASQGALGGDRLGVQNALTAQMMTLPLMQTIGQLESQGYDRATATALAGQQAQFTGANVLSNIGIGGQQALLGGAGAQLGAGGTLEQIAQQQALAQYAGQFIPYQLSMGEAGAIGSLAPLYGTTSTQQGYLTQPPPSPFSQLAGAGLAGGSLLYGLGGSGLGWTPFKTAAQGGAITDRPQRQSGGVAPAMMAGLSPESVTGIKAPTSWPYLHQGGLMHAQPPSMPHLPGASSGTQDIAKSVASLTKGLGGLGGGGMSSSAYPISDATTNTILEGMSVPASASLESSVWPAAGSLPGFDIGGPVMAGLGTGALMPRRGRQIGGDVDLLDPTPLVPRGLDVSAALTPPASRATGVGPVDTRPSGAEATEALYRQNWPAGSADMNRYGPAIASVESGGDYGAVGPVTRTGDRAYGKYQVMGANIPDWTEAALGTRLTPREFLANPQIQDAVFKHRFGSYLDQYGNPQDAASAWFTGQPLSEGAQRADLYGTTGREYIGRFNQALGFAPEEGASEDADSPWRALGLARRQSVAGVGPEATPERGSRAGVGPVPIWPALLAAGLGMMASRSPFAGVAIGEGGLAGLETYSGMQQFAQKQALSEREVDLQAQKLEQEMQRHRDELRERRDYHTGELRKPVVIGQTMDEFGRMHSVYGMRQPDGTFRDPVTNKPIDLEAVRRQQAPPTPAVQPGAGGPQPTVVASVAGQLPAHNATVAAGPYDYARGAPPNIAKGYELPEPAPVGSLTPDLIRQGGEMYLQTGKAPTLKNVGRNPIAQKINVDYQTAAMNYGAALAASRGLTPEQVVDMQRTSPGMVRWIMGQDGRATVSLGVAVRHLDTLQQLNDAVKRNDVQTINRLRAGLGREFGDVNVTNLESAAAIVGTEIIKAMGVAGAGGEHERAAAGALFTAARTPEQVTGAIRTTQSLLAGQLEGKEAQAKAVGVPQEKFKQMIGERPYEILSSMRGQSGGATPSTGSLPQRSPQDQQALDWANANPKDPRAAEIKKRLGVP
jgi:hypothetical protein